MLLIKPYLGCNLHCKYCYENNLRDKYPPKKDYNLEAIFKRMEEFKNLEMSLHGGEILTLPKKDVEALLAKMHELTGRSSIQTNATLIDDDYIKMFKKYKTSIGISWDGPGELSAYRQGSAKVGSIIKRLINKEGLSASIIIVVSKANTGTNQRLNKLKKYLLELNQMKIEGRINPCYGTPGYELDMKKLKEVYLDLADFCLKNNLKWSPFEDIINGLQGKDRVCTFMGCDPFCTQSATVILGDGSITNCMRTNQKGILLRYPAEYKTRDEILFNIPQEYGGCKGCKYWTACYGGCPSGAIDNDWRNRTYLCPLWKTLFEFYEKTLRYFKISLAIDQKPSEPSEEGICQPEGSHGDAPHGDSHGDWSNEAGFIPKEKEHGDAPHGDSHGDSGHGDRADLKHKNIEHGDDGHGDAPHGDAHGDSGHGDHTDLKHGDDGHGDAPHGDAHGDSSYGDKG